MEQQYAPPPEKKSNTTMIIIIVVVVLLLLCCCCMFVGFLMSGPQIESIFQEIEREISYAPMLLSMV